MKKLWILGIIMVVVFALAACGGNDEPAATAAPPSPSPTPTATPAAPVATDDDVDVNGDENGEEEDNGEVENGNGDENGEDENGEEDNNEEDEEDEDEEDEVEPEIEVEPDPEPEVEPEPAPPTVNIPARPAGVVYSLSTDAYFQVLEVGTTGADAVLETPYIQSAGSPTYRVIANPRGGVGLSITNREANHYTIDFVLEELGLNTNVNSYQFTVIGSVSAATTVQFGGADGPWHTLHSQAANGAFTLQMVVTAAHLSGTGAANRIRFQANDAWPNINIYELEVRRVDLVVPPPPATNIPAGAIYSLAGDEGFQGIPMGTGPGDGNAVLQPTGHLIQSGGPHFTIIPNPLSMGGNAFRVSNRSENWHAIDLMRADWDMNTAANSYRIVIRGSAVPGTTMVLGATTSPWSFLHTTTAGANGAFTLEGNLSNSIFAQLANDDPEEGSILPEAGAIGQFNRAFRILTGDGELDPFNVYEVVITRN
jgi:hypothetical protein